VPRCSCTITFLSGVALVGVARAAAVARNDLRGSQWSGITVVSSLVHDRTVRTEHRWHIARFEHDNYILDIRCYLIEYAT
jgi:hypothetical protein